MPNHADFNGTGFVNGAQNTSGTIYTGKLLSVFGIVFEKFLAFGEILTGF